MPNPSWGSLVHEHIFLIFLLPFSVRFPIMLSNVLQGGRWTSAQVLEPSWRVYPFINICSWHGNTTLSNEKERLFIPPNFKHLGFISPSFLYSEVGKSYQGPDLVFLKHFVDDDLCLPINQGGKIARSTDAPYQLGWLLWIMCKSLSLLSHKSTLTQVVVSHFSMCLSSYRLYPTRDKYVRLFNSESPAGSIDMQFHKEPLGWPEAMDNEATGTFANRAPVW